MLRIRFIQWTTSAVLAVICSSAAYADPPIDYDRSGQTPIVRYQEIIGGLDDSDPGPSVEIYGDGRVVVRFPAYMRRAGTHTTVLQAHELDELIAEIVASGATEFDANAVAAARTAVRAQRELSRRSAVGPTAEIRSATDPTTTVIETRLTPDTRPQGRAPRVARWSGVRNDAEFYPEVEALQGLAAAERRLRALMHRSDLKPKP